MPGSRLDADHPENGVLIPCRNTSAALGPQSNELPARLLALIDDLVKVVEPRDVRPEIRRD